MDPLDMEAPPEKREFTMECYVPGSYTKRNVLKWDKSREGKLVVGDSITDVPLLDIGMNRGTVITTFFNISVATLANFLKEENKFYILNFGSYS